eukprot:1215264-Pyramimonas_sp.AAC.1
MAANPVKYAGVYKKCGRSLAGPVPSGAWGSVNILSCSELRASRISRTAWAGAPGPLNAGHSVRHLP